MMRLNMIYVPWVQLSSHIIEELMISNEEAMKLLLKNNGDPNKTIIEYMNTFQ